MKSIRRPAIALGLGVLAFVARAASADPSRIPTEVVDAFHAALARAHAASALSLLARDVVVYEFGLVDATLQAYAFAHLPTDINMAMQTRWQIQTRRMGGSGDQRWVLSSYRVTGKDANGAPIDQVTLETMILRLLGTEYRIVHIHWSTTTAAVSK